jgi:hypothetical protein
MCKVEPRFQIFPIEPICPTWNSKNMDGTIVLFNVSTI